MPVIEGDWLQWPETQSVCNAIAAGGHEVLFVGGCVRNTLMGVDVTDIDISTNALPDEVIRLVERAGLKAVPTGIEHGTITVVSGAHAYEVTTFRRDVETFGRHAVVAFSRNVIDDARRRDFTMNAIYARPDGTLCDPLSGLTDLNDRRVRFVGTAANRIAEDYLRALRFFRFTAHYGDPELGFDADGLAACAGAASELNSLSRERVGSEMMRLLSAPDPAPAVAAMQATGCLPVILPGSDPRALAPLVHLEGLSGHGIDPLLRLASLCAEDAPDRLRLSRAQTRRLAVLNDAARGTDGPGALGYRLCQGDGEAAYLLRTALSETVFDAKAWAQITRGAASPCPVSASDLMPALRGPALGAALSRIEDRWIASDFTASRDDLLGD